MPAGPDECCVCFEVVIDLATILNVELISRIFCADNNRCPHKMANQNNKDVIPVI